VHIDANDVALVQDGDHFNARLSLAVYRHSKRRPSRKLHHQGLGCALHVGRTRRGSQGRHPADHARGAGTTRQNPPRDLRPELKRRRISDYPRKLMNARVYGTESAYSLKETRRQPPVARLSFWTTAPTTRPSEPPSLRAAGAKMRNIRTPTSWLLAIYAKPPLQRFHSIIYRPHLKRSLHPDYQSPYGSEHEVARSSRVPQPQSYLTRKSDAVECSDG
jgi:hypothetical protein